MKQSSRYSVPHFTRRTFLTGAAAAAAFAAIQPAHARQQSLNPYDYITAMEAKPEFGTPVAQAAQGQIEDQGFFWDAYLQMPIKEGQDFHFTCEFDSAWIIMMAYGMDVGLEEQLQLVGQDTSIEPYYEETANGFNIYGGDVLNYFCGHIDTNLVARAKCQAMCKAFEGKGLGVEFTKDRGSIEAALLRGEPVFFKSTVDMMPWRTATWHTNTGDTHQVVFSNDHALVVMGFNDEHVIIRDPLGPTSTNWERPWQWRTTWTRFLEVLAAQENDAIAIGPNPTTESTPEG